MFVGMLKRRGEVFSQSLSSKSVVLVGFLGILLMSGCSTQIDPAVRESPTFQLGYSDGCATGNGRVSGFKDTVKRNDGLYEQEETYKAGWNEGYTACGGTPGRDTDVFGGDDRWYTNGPILPGSN